MIENKEINRTFEKYPAYKDSNTPWIGLIPSHWQVEKGKWLFYKNERPVNKKDEIVTCFRDGEVTLRSNRRIDGFTNALKEHGYQGIRKGDLVIHAMDAFAGAIGVSDSDGKSTPVYSACTERFDNTVNQYYYAYFLRNLALNGVIQSLAKGIRERSSDFRFNDFGDLLLAFPPLSEQTAIATFLDNKTSKIDTAIAQKEQMIALLKERKQIIIQNAVTGKWSMMNGEWSMTPREKMKDSGVEWIGEIPEHWEVKALKYIATLESGDTISSESFVSEGYPVYGGNGFRGYAQTYTNDGHYSLIGRQGALCGNVNYAKGKFFASEHAIVVYHKQGVNVTWLGETIKVADFNRLSQSAAQPGIAVNVIKNVLFPYPSFDEQNRIELYINTQSTKIDRAISLQQSQIEKLKEYKATLIDGAVTGKIMVNG